MFDANFYASLYPDMVPLTPAQRRSHWFRQGRAEGRVGCASQMHSRVRANSTRILSEASYRRHRTTEVPIAVLVRTSQRPAYFNRCMDSVLSQEYANFRLVVCADTDDTMEYIWTRLDANLGVCDSNNSNNSNSNNSNNSNDGRLIKATLVDARNIRCDETLGFYKFNLYCNLLLQCLEPTEYAVFMDDDGEFTHPKCLQMVNDHVEVDRALIWQFMRPDMLVFPNPKQAERGRLRHGEIDTSSVCVHASIARTGHWEAVRGGDFGFFSRVLHAHALKICLLDKIITRTQMTKRIGHFGLNPPPNDDDADADADADTPTAQI